MLLTFKPVRSGQKMKTIILCWLFSCLSLIGFSVKASVISSTVGCNVANLTLTTVKYVDSNVNLLSQPYHATECAYYYGNDDAGGVSSPHPNIGQLNDGLLNGEAGFNYFHFIEPKDLQILDKDNLSDDPGWIHLANLDENFSPNYSNIGPAPQGDGTTIDGNSGGNSTALEDLIRITFACTNGSTGDCTAGTWNLNILDINGLVSVVQSLLGRSAVFDQLAVSLKSRSLPGGQHESIIYNIDFKDIFAAENNPQALNLLTPYNLGGTFNTSDIGGKGISHINVWARDPAQSMEISTPASISIALLALAWILGLPRNFKSY